MGKIINWGILGTGRIANQFASSLQYVADAKLVAIGSRTLDKATEFG